MNIPFRYRRLGYVALNVSDLERSTAFYRDLVGLNISDRSESMVALRCSRDHHNVLLYQAPEPGLKRIGFELESAGDLAAARKHVESLGYPPEEVPPEELKALRTVAAFRFRLPGSGLCLEFFVQMMQLAQAYEPSVT